MQVTELNNERLKSIKLAVITTADGKVYRLEKGKITFPTGAEAEARIVLLICRKYRILRFELFSEKGKMFSHKSPRKVIEIMLEHRKWS